MNKYINIPKYTTIHDIKNNNYSLSASQYKTLCIANSNTKLLKDLLDRDLLRSDLGVEIGSDAYIDKSNYYFVKTKGLQSDTFLLDENKESVQPMIPQSFVNMNLSKGDILISKDSNVGEVIILDKDYPNYMLSSAIYKLPISHNKLYILAFIKSDFFKQQIDFLVPKGATIRHGKTKFLDCEIPFPTQNKDKIIKYVEILMEAIINKEIEIKRKYQLIQTKIYEELINNQEDNHFSYSHPTINEILEMNRMDSALYSKDYKQKQFIIDNYTHGTSSINELGFNNPFRGQNLQISNIGESVKSSTKRKGYYKLILPCYITKFGTINCVEYIGNKNKLKILKQGELIFGAEGNEKGRSYVVIDSDEKTITNIHGVILTQKHKNIQKAIYVKVFLDYLRANGMIDAYAVGGNGGSLAIKYWGLLKFPNFPSNVENDITKLYHNKMSNYDPSSCTIDNFLKYDGSFNQEAGIYELDKSLKYLKNILNQTLENVINDKMVNIKF